MIDLRRTEAPLRKRRNGVAPVVATLAPAPVIDQVAANSAIRTNGMARPGVYWLYTDELKPSASETNAQNVRVTIKCPRQSARTAALSIAACIARVGPAAESASTMGLSSTGYPARGSERMATADK